MEAGHAQTNRLTPIGRLLTVTLWCGLLSHGARAENVFDERAPQSPPSVQAVGKPKGAGGQAPAGWPDNPGAPGKLVSLDLHGATVRQAFEALGAGVIKYGGSPDSGVLDQFSTLRIDLATSSKLYWEAAWELYARTKLYPSNSSNSVINLGHDSERIAWTTSPSAISGPLFFNVQSVAPDRLDPEAVMINVRVMLEPHFRGYDWSDFKLEPCKDDTGQLVTTEATSSSISGSGGITIRYCKIKASRGAKSLPSLKGAGNVLFAEQFDSIKIDDLRPDPVAHFIRGGVDYQLKFSQTAAGYELIATLRAEGDSAEILPLVVRNLMQCQPRLRDKTGAFFASAGWSKDLAGATATATYKFKPSIIGPTSLQPATPTWITWDVPVKLTQYNAAFELKNVSLVPTVPRVAAGPQGAPGRVAAPPVAARPASGPPAFEVPPVAKAKLPPLPKPIAPANPDAPGRLVTLDLKNSSVGDAMVKLGAQVGATFIAPTGQVFSNRTKACRITLSAKDRTYWEVAREIYVQSDLFQAGAEGGSVWFAPDATKFAGNFAPYSMKGPVFLTVSRVTPARGGVLHPQVTIRAQFEPRLTCVAWDSFTARSAVDGNGNNVAANDQDFVTADPSKHGEITRTVTVDVPPGATRLRSLKGTATFYFGDEFESLNVANIQGAQDAKFTKGGVNFTINYSSTATDYNIDIVAMRTAALDDSTWVVISRQLTRHRPKLFDAKGIELTSNSASYNTSGTATSRMAFRFVCRSFTGKASAGAPQLLTWEFPVKMTRFEMPVDLQGISLEP